ncbi:cell agglutination protein Mam3 [Exophiala xenobiotica]|nr:cell agglutination protein Mam3 [Exophiala xenobiotica]
MAARATNSYLATRPTILGLAKVLVLSLAQVPFVRAAPVHASHFFFAADDEEGKDPGDPSLWIYLSFAAVLVLLGGAFAGLTIALMGQDEMYLRVIRDSGEGAEKKHATKVLNLLQKGKHWVLVTLLLSNVITNETLPIVLDRSLGGGWPAVLGSTVLIVIFGEIAPQSVCVRYGLPIGSWMAPFVLVLMYLLAPIAWPTAKLLDYLLGEDHGTVYKKTGLKSLVSLHRNLGEPGQQLNADEVTIISAVLDLKEKPIGSIMTPMDDVFTLSLDDVLDEATMDDILSQGYSRIPVHHPDNDSNFIGMLLVKMLITYDPEDAKPVRDFALATLPETRPDTSCLDIVNFFQEGKSHMVLVSEYPGEDHGAIGVVTLEDVIEELIGEEIVDESDVFVDVHKAIRRAMPAPTRRIPKSYFVSEPPTANGAAADLVQIGEGETLEASELQKASELQRSKTADNSQMSRILLNVRRRSSAGNSLTGDLKTGPRGSRMSTDDAVKEQLKHLGHLGPSNLASRPRTTRYATVKIKPGTDTTSKQDALDGRATASRRVSDAGSSLHTGIGEGVLKSAGKDASDGVQALHQEHPGYGTISDSPSGRPASHTKGVQADLLESSSPTRNGEGTNNRHDASRPVARTFESHSTIRSLPGSRSRSKSPYYKSKGPARSGSITENIIDANGFRKVVLETTSSSESAEEEANGGGNKGDTPAAIGEESVVKLQGGVEDHNQHSDTGKKKKRRRRKQKHGKGGEHEPLLADNQT